ncbi:MAG TPA: phospholipase D-like domain-containing protein [Solirubrobacteraceae bacterium]|nr:phospholipase D-like domain-containing protein [Solirubrobacteraceae bacterium]
MGPRRLLLIVCALALCALPGTAMASGPSLALVAEPQAGDAPFVAMIAGARHSVQLTIYALDDQRVEQALVQAAARKVDVRVLLYRGEYVNRSAYAYLSRNGVHVRYAPAYLAITHQKTLTVDGTQSAIMTLNLYAPYGTTRDFAILDRQPADVQAIISTFDADWAGRPIAASSGSGDLVWSPGAQSTVLGLIDSARRSIELENEEMDYRPATEALCAAAERGVSVKIVMTYQSEWRSAFEKLRDCGVDIHLYYGQHYYIHAKLLLVDGHTALVGSQNLSTESLRYNRELGITVTNAAIVSELERDFASDYDGGSGT